MSYVKIWIHAVWTTKNRTPILAKEKRQEVFRHIHENGMAKNVLVDIVGGHNNHVHCLFRLRNDQTVMKTVQLLKGESAHWVNKMQILPERLVWQKEYFAISVSESQIPKVRTYISNQEEHHKKVTWLQEYTELISKYNFRIIKG